MTRHILTAALYGLLLLSTACGAGCWDGAKVGGADGARDGWEANQ